MQVNFYPLARGIASYVLPEKIFLRPGSGGTFSSKYCYSVWLRHLVQLKEQGLVNDLSKIQKVAEMGPGDSLGIGMASLLTGAKEYHAFDVIEHANLERNIQITKNLSQLFLEKKEVPHQEMQFRNTKPRLSNYAFPFDILAHLSSDILQNKLEAIKAALRKEKSEVKVSYQVPWDKKESGLHGEIDLIFSQAVMEHVDNIQHAYTTMYKWLKPGGIISHQIDYKAHEMTKEWNGHWYINKKLWDVLLHGRKYSINRFPHSAHVKAIEEAGFTIKNVVPVIDKNEFAGKTPKVTKCTFTEEDMTISSALIQAVK